RPGRPSRRSTPARARAGRADPGQAPPATAREEPGRSLASRSATPDVRSLASRTGVPVSPRHDPEHPDGDRLADQVASVVVGVTALPGWAGAPSNGRPRAVPFGAVPPVRTIAEKGKVNAPVGA